MILYCHDLHLLLPMSRIYGERGLGINVVTLSLRYLIPRNCFGLEQQERKGLGIQLTPIHTPPKAMYIISLTLFLTTTTMAAMIDHQSNDTDRFVHLMDQRDLEVVSRTKRDTQIYYKGLGWFKTDGEFYNIFKRPFNVIPQSPEMINTNFMLHTRSNPDNGQLMKYGDEDGILHSYFDVRKQTKMIVHGFLDDGFKNWVKVMVKELLHYSDMNVIVVDWGSGSGIPYFQATANTRVVGALIAQFLKYLQDKSNVTSMDCHIIGHSLGAHAAGYAGERLDNLSRITGLDPAEPYFQGMPKSVRLDVTDAQFVDVIHTDDSSIFGMGFGIKDKCGHVDFYINNGDDQPGCDSSGKVITYFVKGLKQGIRKTFSCDHLRVLELFSDSVNSICPFTGFQCNTWTDFMRGKCGDCGDDGTKCLRMGLHADKYTQQSNHIADQRYYLKTSDRLPFCLYNYQVKIKLDDHPKGDLQQGDLYLTMIGTGRRIIKIKLNKKTMKLDHPGKYNFLVTNINKVGKIQELRFEWDYDYSLLDPSTYPWYRKLFGKGVKLFVKSVQINQMDVTNPSIKARLPSVFCGNKDEGIEENTSVSFYAKAYCLD